MKNIKLAILGGSTLVAIILCFIVYNSLQTYNDNYLRIQSADDKIIKELNKIRIAQKSHFDVTGRYAPTWDSLALFLKQAEFPIVQKSEEIINLGKGIDSIAIKIDTLDMIAVYDSLKYKLDLESIEEVDKIGDLPQVEGQFTLYVSVRGSDQFIEVADPKPINPRRKDAEDELKPLRFGSKSAVSTKGNWE